MRLFKQDPEKKAAADAEAAAAAEADPGKYEKWLGTFKENIIGLKKSCEKIKDSFDPEKSESELPAGLKKAIKSRNESKKRLTDLKSGPKGYITEPFVNAYESGKTWGAVADVSGKFVKNTVWGTLAAAATPVVGSLALAGIAGYGTGLTVAAPIIGATAIGEYGYTGKLNNTKDAVSTLLYPIRSGGKGGKKTKKQKNKRTKKRKRKQNHKRTKKI
jgi:hypothetical protein